jgi:hypothetical protein
LILTGFHDSRPRDPEYPVVCLDETSKQLIAETRVPIPAKPGRPARIDYEYKRNGTANIFMLFAPLEGWRHVEVTDRHTAVDYAHLLKQVSDGERVHIPSISILPIPGVPDTRLDRPQLRSSPGGATGPLSRQKRAGNPAASTFSLVEKSRKFRASPTDAVGIHRHVQRQFRA